MLRSIILSSLFCVFGVSYANPNQCDTDINQLSASFSVSKTQKASGQTRTNALSVWRNGNQVAHQHHDSNVTEIWQKMKNDKLFFVRHFEEQQRGIEYQPGEIKTANHVNLWQQKNQFVLPKTLSKLKVISTSGQGCDKVSEYRGNINGASLHIIWLDHLHLVKSLEQEMSKSKTVWQLSKLSYNKEQITKFFKQRDRYQTTDYADIGDNESDPFLLNMINLGFIEHGNSGFYDAAGNELAHRH